MLLCQPKHTRKRGLSFFYQLNTPREAQKAGEGNIYDWLTSACSDTKAGNITRDCEERLFSLSTSRHVTFRGRWSIGKGKKQQRFCFLEGLRVCRVTVAIFHSVRDGNMRARLGFSVTPALLGTAEEQRRPPRRRRPLRLLRLLRLLLHRPNGPSVSMRQSVRLWNI